MFSYMCSGVHPLSFSVKWVVETGCCSGETAECHVSFAPQPLQSLSLADSKLKTEVTIIINALGSNTSLTKVDISGNGMGDMGAKMLAKALQINTKLR
ncbi:hypothetical protein P7K49_007138 [Saguinus oedipus]|uniref:Uncharacterized protein n=1 Tax=Saguinus oedipus TaxID=9490 RepID=A0ABQ9VU75_SAGOE|nr:hypothetical protein P7K49_007138 [Saguinus oedipus]